jgi:hypothetical protein
VYSAVRVLADLSVQAGITFDGYPGTVFSDRQRFTTRPRASVALEVDVTDTIELATGIQ